MVDKIFSNALEVSSGSLFRIVVVEDTFFLAANSGEYVFERALSVSFENGKG
tara:strand:+ start:557 stop:712 length:156 start_codon:yes stop_codon:yes gene_type:complete